MMRSRKEPRWCEIAGNDRVDRKHGGGDERYGGIRKADEGAGVESRGHRDRLRARKTCYSSSRSCLADNFLLAIFAKKLFARSSFPSYYEDESAISVLLGERNLMYLLDYSINRLNLISQFNFMFHEFYES